MVVRIDADRGLAIDDDARRARVGGGGSRFSGAWPATVDGGADGGVDGGRPRGPDATLGR
jgi:hypothetical protein